MPAKGERSHPLEGVKGSKKRLPKLPRAPEAVDLDKQSSIYLVATASRCPRPTGRSSRRRSDAKRHRRCERSRRQARTAEARLRRLDFPLPLRPSTAKIQGRPSRALAASKSRRTSPRIGVTRHGPAGGSPGPSFMFTSKSFACRIAEKGQTNASLGFRNGRNPSLAICPLGRQT
jgi:hypothetical protein